MTAQKKAARIAGLWYAMIAVFYSFSMIYVDSSFYVPGDAASTIRNIQASELMLRLGLVSCLVGHICFLFLANSLYGLFESVDRSLARQMVILVIAGVSVAFLNRLNQLAAIVLLSGQGDLAGFDPTQIQSLVMFFLELHRYGELMASLFWALWLLPLGILILKSGFIPKALGAVLIAACFSYLVGFVLHYFFPVLAAPTETARSVIETCAEVSLILWLLIKGVTERDPTSREKVAAK